MNTLTFTVILPNNVGNIGTNLSIDIIGTNLHVDWDDGTTTTQEPNTERIQETHWLDNFTSWTVTTSDSKSWTVTITGDIIGVGTNCFNLGGNYVTEITLPEGLETIEHYGLRKINAEKVIIPSTVTNIGNYFLYQSGVKEVVFLTENLTELKRWFLFEATQVKSVKLPEGLISFDTDYTTQKNFYNCTSLKTLEVPSTLEAFPISNTNANNFVNVQLETLKMNGGPISNPPITENTKIVVPLNKLQDFINHSDYPDERERYDIFGKSLSEKIYILGTHLAENLQDKNIVASADDGLTTLANKIDDIYENIPRVIIEDDTVTDFADLRFTVITPANCLKLKINSFTGCNNLVRCIIQEGPRLLEMSAFSNCSNLQIVELPSTIRSLDGYVFSNLPSLHTLTFKSLNPPALYNSGHFKSLPTTCTIEVPIGSLKAYKNTSNYPDPNVYTYRSLYYVNDFSDSSTISDFTDSKGTITKSITNGELVLTAPNNDEHLTYCNKAKLPKGDWKVTINSTTYNFIAVKIGYDPLDSNATVFDCTWNYGWSLVKINSDWSQTTVKPSSSIYLGTTGVWVFEYIDKTMKIYQDNVLKATYDLTSYDTIGGYVMIGDCCNRTNRISELIIEEL